MGEQRKVFILLVIMCLGFAVLLPNIVFASSENWVEVVRHTRGGVEDKTTAPFTCDHADWRIRYEFYYDHTHFPDFPHFSVRTYPLGEKITPINEIVVNGYGEKSGTSYVYNNSGTFYMKIDTLNPVESYTIIVEQNIASIPELLSSAVLTLTMITILAAIVVKKRFL